jgi:hypothetical protein
MRKKVLNFMVVITGCLFYQLSYAQVFTNNGALVHVQSGALVHINGGLENRDNGMNQGIFNNHGSVWCANSTGFWGDFNNTNGGEMNLENGSHFYVARNYTNDADLFGKFGSNVYFNGNTNQVFTRTAAANIDDDFYRVYIQNTATGNNGVRLASGSTISNMVVRNQLQFDNGIIITDLPAADAYPYVPGAAGSGNYVEVWGTITGTDPNVTYSDKYVAGILRRLLPMATGIVNFPVGGLRANPATEKEMNQIGFDFTSVPNYGQYLTVYFRPGTVPGSPDNIAECGNDGYDAWIGNGRWIVIPDDNTGNAGYHVRTHPRNYDAIYTTYDYTQYTGNASATVQKATTGMTDWNVYGTCNPASTLNPMATALVIRNGQSGFSEFAVSVDDDKPFPVEMLPLVAVPDNTNQFIKLYWNTLSEVNNAGFEIQRSLDGSSFNKIHPGAWVNGQGNSNSQVNYTYDDRMVEPNVKYYYRLKQIDFNGAYKYSNIAEAILSPNFQFGVVFYPNPTQDIMNLTLTSDKDQSLNLIVYNAIGQQIFNETYNVKPGASNIQLDAFRNITKGVYTAVISNGSETITHKLVKIQ